MKDLSKRVVTGVIGVIVLIGSILWSQYSFGIFFLIITMAGLWEFYNLIENKHVKPQKYLGTALGGLVFVANFIFAQRVACGEKTPLTLLLVVVPLAFLFFLFELFKKHPNPFTNISFSLSGIIYIAFPFGILNYVVMYPGLMASEYYHPEMLISYFLILWASDTGAYFAGNFFGKTKLFERISPNKTWEGFAGGIALSVIISIVVSRFIDHIDVIDWMVIGFMISVFGTLGDLVESYFKRGLGIKDSGNILPGHGGILDRFDSLLLSVPFVFVYFRLFIYD
ncbi:MAG: phosphatidate cytidylyltransferase [Flavobacteriales bacterium]|nr:phosphatidate cytidylyltransferase [Flavobacteriales bacterium]